MKLEHFLTPHTKVNSKWIRDLNVRPEPIKLLDKTGKTLSDINHSRILYDPPPRILKIKAKINKFLKKLEIELPYDPAIPLLGILTEDTRIERDTCTPMFIAALFTIARTWKQPRCPLADKWIRKSWYICTMGYYSPIKKEHLSQF